jgi:ABC-2 type transport system ATP-binding protein
VLHRRHEQRAERVLRPLSEPAMTAAVSLQDVTVAFGSVRALDGINLSVDEGAIVGVLGHNGAGKTTAIRVAATLLRPASGAVRILGIDALRQPERVRHHIGVTGQYAGLDDYLTARENLQLFGRLVGLGRHAPRRAEELLDRFDLGDLADRRVGALSGGSRRRVDLAASLVGQPAVLFLDEPTTGLDPVARASFWAEIRRVASAGTAVVLTTQYLEEADQLADRIAVIDHGRVVATGTPAELKAIVGGKVVRASVPIDGRMTTVHHAVADASAAAALVQDLRSSTVLADLEVASPSLDDVFHHLAAAGASA